MATVNIFSVKMGAFAVSYRYTPCKVEYNPGKEILTADALSRLYSKHVLCADGDPDWPMLIMGDFQEGFLPRTPMDIQEKVLKNKHLFKNVYGTLPNTFKW
ncbi:hypothetical protein DSO57_1036455 [Entomophthora muscae]|uniref:Uncharacterized protein n=1 Tax=Entomophthora muscae TaxID=34485 RepID=A0ACC2RE10_9FUNG|nr:hypothetical protein DSO57_1036455 [Entomophthora muscae]